MQDLSFNKTPNRSTFALYLASVFRDFMSAHITLLSIFIVCCFAEVTKGQSQNPVKWEFNAKKLTDREVEILATATMQAGWVIYSQNTDEGGPIPTSFTIAGKSVQFEEKTTPDSVFDEMFDMTVLKFKNKALFTLRIPVSDSRRVLGTVEFMTCDGTRCLPPKEIQFDEIY
jgi:hypothetical protein